DRNTPSSNIPAASEPVKVLHYSKPAGLVLPPLDQDLNQRSPRTPPATPPAAQNSLLLDTRNTNNWPSTERLPASQPPRPASLATGQQGRDVRQIMYQQRSPQQRGMPDEMTQEYSIQLEPPGPQELFRLDSEAALMERMRQKARERVPAERIEFPVE